ncbi:hypothetical protein JCM17960_26770 [Magnetospira thiophila]
MPGEGASFTWMAGRQGQGAFSFQRLYLYHLPKTGSSTVFSALRGAAGLVFDRVRQAYPGFQPPFVGRLDDEGKLHDDTINLDVGLMASHRPFGFHQRFPCHFTLMTVLRDPLGRCLSAYTYDAMRHRLAVSADGFRAHFEAPQNQNVMTALLSGKAPGEPLDERDLQRAIHHLRMDFGFFGSSSHIPALCSAYLQWSDLPNVVVDRINRTEPAYRLDGAPFAAEVLGLNILDQALFLFARDHARLSPPEPMSPGAPHDLTLLLRQTTNDTSVRGLARVVPTEWIPPEARQTAFNGDLFEDLFARGAAVRL